MLYTSSGTRGTPCARDVLDAWLTAPVDHAQRATAALHCLSYLLNPADPAARPAQERLLGLTGKGLKQVRAAFADAARAPGATDQGQQARATAAVTFADNLARLLLHRKRRGRREPAGPGTEAARRPSAVRAPDHALLEGLSEIHVPRVTQHIVEQAGLEAGQVTAQVIAAPARLRRAATRSARRPRDPSVLQRADAE